MYSTPPEYLIDHLIFFSIIDTMAMRIYLVFEEKYFLDWYMLSEQALILGNAQCTWSSNSLDFLYMEMKLENKSVADFGISS